MRRQKLLVVCLVLLLAVSLVGCSKVSLGPGSIFSSEENTPAVPASAPAEININEVEPPGPTVTVELYFADTANKTLVSEKRHVPEVVGIARATMEELLKGPAPGSSLQPAVPPGTSLLDINVRNDGLCVVDLSKEMRSESLDPAGENLAVYSVVNTLTQFPTVKRVQILVNGQKVEDINGTVIVSEPLVRDSGLVSQL